MDNRTRAWKAAAGPSGKIISIGGGVAMNWDDPVLRAYIEANAEGITATLWQIENGTWAMRGNAEKILVAVNRLTFVRPAETFRSKVRRTLFAAWYGIFQSRHGTPHRPSATKE